MFDQPTYIGETFKQLKSDGMAFEGITFKDCKFDRCRLSECEFRKCRFEDCRWENSDLSLAKFPMTAFIRTRFIESRLAGVNWCLADWAEHSLLHIERLDFEDCLLDHGVFIGLGLKATRFSRCKARGTDFESADLARADFSQADLEGARFVNCNLAEANFVGAKNYRIDAAQNKLHQTRFSLPEALALLHSLDIVLED